ncbi:G-protein coupled receptor 183-like [Poecilia latipinna]|uniref:G-protein coupled receptor 183-like n=1 Tax=Poecilia latipinna TaxID=48699 RepID=UPI00072E9445|nr:PREDICTED: G-protein coupled receptor 183-like [Poecilia latipinna]
MNISIANVTGVPDNRDSFTKAVIKNVIVVVLSISINYINAGLIHTFCGNQIFNTNPRYILFVHLVINDMIQVTLTVALFIISYILYKIHVFVCCILILIALFTTENTPLNLACMAVECYIAICIPLRHAQICTIKRTRLLISLIWITSLVSVLPDLFITLATEPLDYFNTQVFCLRETAFRSPRIIERRNITYIVYLVLVWCIIFFIYFRILFTARTASRHAKKARNTVLLHGLQLLLCMATYAEHLVKQAVLQWLPKYYSDSLFVCYIIFQILPRSISSIIYGIRDKTFRKHLKRPKEMNVSAANVTVIEIPFTKVLLKNLIVVGLCVFINSINAGLIYTFSKHQIFNTNPRYILFVHLVINDMIQVTLSVALFVTSYLFYLPMTVCCFFILIAIFTTENTPLNLACMAVECYIAICIPLRHAQICTVKKTRLLISLIWATSLVSVLPDLFMTLATESQDYFKLRVFCIRERVFPNPRIIERRNITYIVYLVLVWCIIFSPISA